jgi:hypothetical protein
MILYADDIALIHPLSEEDSSRTIQEDINQIALSTVNLELNLNASKCKYQIISLTKRKRVHVQLNLNGVQLEEVSVCRYFGIHVDSKLNFAL